MSAFQAERVGDASRHLTKIVWNALRAAIH